MKAYIGIDPGQKGGIGMINNAGMAVEYEPMPVTVKEIVKLVEGYVLNALKNGEKPRLIVELAQPMPKQGAVSAFTYGRHFGAFEPLHVVLDIPYHEVRPGIWKKAMGLNSEKVNSINLCERIFPTVGLILPRCRVKHDGIAEALLIAEWGRRQGL